MPVMTMHRNKLIKGGHVHEKKSTTEKTKNISPYRTDA